MNKNTCFVFVLFVYALSLSIVHAEDSASSQASEVRALEQRLQNLETLIGEQQSIIEQLQETTTAEAATAAAESDVSALDISGFFDVQARNREEQRFDMGDLEVDLEYVHDAHFSASAALVWDGEGATDVAAAIVDYHLYDDSIPPRGRIFGEPGFHLQLGRFDIPFGADYQYFASVDRPNITAPLTTERIQQGGYNSDGLRTYGSWKNFDGALFWSNSIYADTGYTVGARIGLSLGQNPYSFHQRMPTRDVELGLSYLQDRDGSGNRRNLVYAADLTLRYEAITLVSEYFSRNNDEDLANDGGALLEQRDETGYHISLLADMQGLLQHPLALFARYERWSPDYNFIADADDANLLYAVNALRRITLGLNYRFTDYFQFKLEYFDHLGHDTEEPDYEENLGLAQVVVNF